MQPNGKDASKSGIVAPKPASTAHTAEGLDIPESGMYNFDVGVRLRWQLEEGGNDPDVREFALAGAKLVRLALRELGQGNVQVDETRTFGGTLRDCSQ